MHSVLRRSRILGASAVPPLSCPSIRLRACRLVRHQLTHPYGRFLLPGPTRLVARAWRAQHLSGDLLRHDHPPRV